MAIQTERERRGQSEEYIRFHKTSSIFNYNDVSMDKRLKVGLSIPFRISGASNWILM